MTLKVLLFAVMALLCGLVAAEDVLRVQTAPRVPEYEELSTPTTATYTTTYTQVSFVFTGAPDTLTVFSTVPVTVTEVETRTYWPKELAGRDDPHYTDGVYDCSLPATPSATLPEVRTPNTEWPTTTTFAALLPPQSSFPVLLSSPPYDLTVSTTMQTSRTATTTVGTDTTAQSTIGSAPPATTEAGSTVVETTGSQTTSGAESTSVGTETATTGTTTGTGTSGTQTPSAPPNSGAGKADATLLGFLGAGLLAVFMAI